MKVLFIIECYILLHLCNIDYFYFLLSFVSVANSSPTFQQTLSTIFNNVNHIRPSISYNGFLHSSCLRTSIFSAAWLPA